MGLATPRRWIGDHNQCCILTAFLIKSLKQKCRIANRIICFAVVITATEDRHIDRAIPCLQIKCKLIVHDYGNQCDMLLSRTAKLIFNCMLRYLSLICSAPHETQCMLSLDLRKSIGTAHDCKDSFTKRTSEFATITLLTLIVSKLEHCSILWKQLPTKHTMVNLPYSMFRQ